MSIEVTDIAELEIERRFSRRYVYGTTLLPPSHYRSSLAREQGQRASRPAGTSN